MTQTFETIHATAVTLAGDGVFRPQTASSVAVVLRGPSGSGKSDLALRLIAAHGARLLADDRVALAAAGGCVRASAPENIAGMLEVRGLGLMRLPNAAPTAVALVVDLVARSDIERLPEPASVMLCNIAVPLIRLHAFDASTPHKIIAALAVVEDAQMVVS